MSDVFDVGILEFNPHRMTPDERERSGIPSDMPFLADSRQYAPRIGSALPSGVAWFDPATPTHYRDVLSDGHYGEKFLEKESLIFSGSSLSAFSYRSGDGLSTEDSAYVQKAELLVREFVNQGKWVFGIGFGGQLAISAVGGAIGRLPQNGYGTVTTEAGWLSHELTDEGLTDEVFSLLSPPRTFYAPQFHSDIVTALPQVGAQVVSGVSVVQSDVLAVRYGFLGRTGIENSQYPYIHAARVIFNNGARVYHLQPHPEMAVAGAANFLVRQNTWLGDQNRMGILYYEQALRTPDQIDPRVRGIISSFARQAKAHLERVKNFRYRAANLQPDFRNYLIP